MSLPNEIDEEIYDFGMRIKKLRANYGWTQSDLAERIGSATDSISCYEQNYRYPPIPRLMKLAKVLHVSVDYLLGIDDDPSIKLYGLTDEGKEVMDGFVKIFIDQK